VLLIFHLDKLDRLYLASTLAGFIGALLGLGGGIIIVPTLTLFFGVDIRYAIPASLCATIATSLSASYYNLKSELVNIRLASLLEMSTVWGAITGFMISYFVSEAYLFYTFGFFLMVSSVLMFLKKTDSIVAQSDALAEKLQLTSEHPVQNIYLGSIVMYVAGILSALLGVGGGILKTLAMDIIMKVPIKVSSATSNFMIGVTAAASTGGYFIKGDILTELVTPIVFGTTLGSFIGAIILKKISGFLLRKIFVFVLLIVAFQMFWKGYHT
jgi:uncharacterized protein